ncbi:DUF3089 domain-containing protein [Desulfotalea psychrophila]|nr:DUF3089 domain-containing protein [Desulfotalea psychrophila]
MKYNQIFAILLLLLCSCARQGSGEAIVDTVPNYSQSSSWLYQPGRVNKPIDLFYVYPTIYAEKNPANMNIGNRELRQRARHLIDAQASVYGESANIFAPLYRQMSMARLDGNSDALQSPFFQKGYEDVARAFDFYLQHLNGGRPFILAGHSQGSMVLIQLMRKKFADRALQKKLVAAYLIGYSVTAEDFKNYPWMKPAQGASDTGVIISYNTQSITAKDSPVLLPGAYGINPLNWSRTEPANKSMNRGAVFFRDNEIEREIPHYAGAYIDPATGALITQLPEKLNTGSFPAGVYHRFDYALWFRNLEENVQNRCETYLSTK